MENVKIKVFGFIGILGGIIAAELGGWDAGLKTLIIFMSIDYITGIALALFFQNSNKTVGGQLQSGECWKGICRKVMTLMMVLVAHQIDIVSGTNFVRDAVIIAYVVNEVISIIENAGLMGLPIPDELKKGIEALHKDDKK